MESLKKMKRIILSLIFAVSVIGAFGQSGSLSQSVYRSRVNDSTSVTEPSGYGLLYYNNQRAVPKWIFSNDQGTTWQELGSGSGGGGDTFTSDVTFTLPAGFTFGKYDNGDTAPWTGLTAVQAMQDAAIAYINPTWNSFSNNQATPVEWGTTISGAKTFTWSLNANSGVVSTIDIYDITAGSTLLASTPNDGTQSVSITSIQLNTAGATQSWRGIANNSSPSGTVNSSTWSTIGWPLRFSGPTATAPTNSATVRALPSSAFVTGAGSFTLATGNTLVDFIVALPPGRSITSVIDQSALNADITSSYVLQSSINVLDAGGTNRAYVIYKCTIAVPYGASHNHLITFI